MNIYLYLISKSAPSETAGDGLIHPDRKYKILPESKTCDEEEGESNNGNIKFSPVIQRKVGCHKLLSQRDLKNPP
jgi:hypothetical protein